MRRLLGSAAVLAIAILAFAAEAQPQDKMMKKEKTITVTGQLIDTKCFSMNEMNKGPDHTTMKGEMKGCATLCAKLGIPVAVLTEKGDAWTLVTPAQDLAEHMGSKARITGVKVFGGHQIRPEKIEVQAASGKWNEVMITMPMPG